MKLLVLVFAFFVISWFVSEDSHEVIFTILAIAIPALLMIIGAAYACVMQEPDDEEEV